VTVRDGGERHHLRREYEESWMDSKKEEVDERVIHDTGACHTDGCLGNVTVGHSVLDTPLKLGHRVPERP